MSQAMAPWARAEQVRLEHEAPETCPDVQAFMGEVRARTDLAVFSVAAMQPRTFRVVIAEQGEGYRGQLTIINADGSSTDRAFEGERCAEITSALALVTALAIDPNAKSGPVDLPEEPVIAPPVVVSEAPREPEPSRPAPAPPPAPAPALPKASWAITVGAHLSLQGWVAPDPVVGADLFGEVRSEDTSLLSPAFRLGVLHSRSDVLGAGAKARWSWSAGRAEACPVRLPLSEAWEEQPCIALEAGAIHGRGIDVAHPGEADRLWLATGVTNGLVWRRDAWMAELRMALWAPLTRYRYVFRDPWVDVHEVPSLCASVAVGGGVRF